MDWKTLACGLNNGDGGGDGDALMLLLWVSCPDEEDGGQKGEVKATCSCKEEALEVLLLP